MAARLTPRAVSEQAKAEVRQRLKQARENARLTLRELALAMTEAHGHRVSFAHLARVESGERRITRDLLVAWGSATTQPDPQSWAEELIDILGQDRLGRSRQVLPMEFRPPDLPDVSVNLLHGEHQSRLRSPDVLYARIADQLSKAARGADPEMPVIVTTRGPLATAFHELRQSVASLSLATRQLVQLTAARNPDERLRAVEQALAGSARLGNRYEPLLTTAPGEWAYDIIAVPGADSAVVLSLPGGGYLWLSVPTEDYPHLRDHLEPALQAARSRRVIELVRSGPQVTQYWFGEWEATMLQHEKDVTERLFLQPHPGLLTIPQELAAIKARQEAHRSSATDSDIDTFIQLRAERIAIFQRKLRAGDCRYRDIACAEPINEMAENGYTHIRDISLPDNDNPADRLRRLRQAREHFSYLRDLVASDESYDLRLVPESEVPRNRQWCLVRQLDPDTRERVHVLLIFTLSDQARPDTSEQPSFVNAIVRDEQVTHLFKEDFEALWAAAPGRDHTLGILQKAIDRITENIKD